MKYKTFEEFWKDIWTYEQNFKDIDTLEQGYAEVAWNIRQQEIDELLELCKIKDNIIRKLQREMDEMEED